MNLHGNTTTKFVREWQAGESPLHSSVANQSRWDGADPALGQEQVTFEAMFNALPSATMLTDLHGEIRRVNPAFTTLFGFHPHDVIGKSLELLHVCMADDHAAGRFQPHGHTGDNATPVDVSYRTNDGGTFIGETVVTAVTHGDGRVLGWLHLIRDITDRKHANALVEADLARLAKKHRYESIVSAVAHSVHQSTNLQAVLENAVEAMRTHLERIDAIEIFLREGEEAALKAYSGLPDWVIAQIHRMPAPQGYTWKVIGDGQPRYCADVDLDAFIHPAGRAFGVKSYVSMPISAEGQTVGAININALHTHAFDDDELRLLEILSAHLETAIHNAQQAEALRHALAEVERLKNRLQAENAYLQEELTTTHRGGEIIGHSRALQEVLRRVAQVAPTAATVLIQGETGTGKELIARAIHQQSRAWERPLVKVNCATLPAGLVESELFGHEKGAFTGAVARKIGRFELADGGTIFLDEVGELPLALQAKLLRVLQEGEFERVGGSYTIAVNVRVIAATNPSHEPPGGGAGPHPTRPGRHARHHRGSAGRGAHLGAPPQYAAVPPAETWDQEPTTPPLNQITPDPHHPPGSLHHMWWSHDIWWGLPRRSAATSPPLSTKSPPCAPFCIPPRVVRNWHWLCLVLRGTRWWHEQDEIDIWSEPRAHQPTRRCTMAIRLNHINPLAMDKGTTAEIFADIYGLTVRPGLGHFARVQVNESLNHVVR